jgi:hypothetical protein
VACGCCVSPRPACTMKARDLAWHASPPPPTPTHAPPGRGGGSPDVLARTCRLTTGASRSICRYSSRPLQPSCSCKQPSCVPLIRYTWSSSCPAAACWLLGAPGWCGGAPAAACCAPGDDPRTCLSALGLAPPGACCSTATQARQVTSAPSRCTWPRAAGVPLRGDTGRMETHAPDAMATLSLRGGRSRSGSGGPVALGMPGRADTYRAGCIAATRGASAVCNRPPRPRLIAAWSMGTDNSGITAWAAMSYILALPETARGAGGRVRVPSSGHRLPQSSGIRDTWAQSLCLMRAAPGGSWEADGGGELNRRERECNSATPATSPGYLRTQSAPVVTAACRGRFSGSVWGHPNNGTLQRVALRR